MMEPAKENINEQLNTLRNIHKRISEDMKQSEIILNHIEDNLTGGSLKKKRVRFTSSER